MLETSFKFCQSHTRAASGENAGYICTHSQGHWGTRVQQEATLHVFGANWSASRYCLNMMEKERYLPLSGIKRLLLIIQPATLPAELSCLTSCVKLEFCVLHLCSLPVSTVWHRLQNDVSYKQHNAQSWFQVKYLCTTLLTAEITFFNVSTVLRG